MGRSGFESWGAAPLTGFSSRGGPRAWASRGLDEINDLLQFFVSDAATSARPLARPRVPSRQALACDQNDLAWPTRGCVLLFSSTSQEVSIKVAGVEVIATGHKGFLRPAHAGFVPLIASSKNALAYLGVGGVVGFSS